MSFSQVSISHTYVNLDGTPASGTVTFELTEPIRNGGTTIAASIPLAVSLDGSGNLSVTLPATDDAATIPSGALYTVTEKIAGAAQQEYSISVPSASAGQTVDLASLLPQETTVA